MREKKIFNWFFGIVFVLLLVAVFIFENAAFNPQTTAMADEQKKSQLQEQLGEELRAYYMGEDNWQQCQDLIQQIENFAD